MTMLTNPALIDLDIGAAAVIALLGYGVVFLGLILLMIVVMILGKSFSAAEKRNAVTQEVPAQQPVEEAPKATAPGAAGQIKLHNVDPKTAAILMAITADKMGKPINELRFISIKEVN